MNHKRRKMIKKIISYGIIVTFIYEGLFSSNCFASTVKYSLSDNDVAVKTKSVSELMEKFQKYSEQLKQIEEKYSLKNVEAQISEQSKNQTGMSLAVVSRSIGTYSKMKNELVSTINNLQTEYDDYIKSDDYEEEIKLQYEAALKEDKSQLDTVNNQIESLNESYHNTNVQYVSKTLESDLNQFYVKNRELCINNESKQINYEFYNKILSLILLNEQNKYYDCQDELYKTQEKVERIKLNMGQSTIDNLNLIQVGITSNNAKKNDVMTSYNTTFTYVCDEVEESNIEINYELITGKKSYDPQKIIEQILSENITYLQLKDMIKVYQNYLNSGNYITELQQQQISILIASYITEKELLEKSINKYVNSCISTYEQEVINIKVNENMRNSFNHKLKVKQEEYSKGRATLLDVESINQQLSESVVNYYKELVKKMEIEYILDHSLYGINIQ